MLGLRLNPRHPASFFFAYFGAVAVLILILNLLLSVMRLRASLAQEWQKERLRTSLEFIGTIPPQKPLTLMLGTSEMQSGFDPLEFDRVMAENRGRRSYMLNMAVDNLGRWTPLYLARLIYELKARDLRPKIVFIHIPGMWLTEHARQFTHYEAKFFDLPPILYNRELLWNFPAEREDRVMAAINKWVFAERSLLQLPFFFKTLSPQRAKTPSEVARWRLWFRPEFHTYPAWNPAVQGRFQFNIEEYPQLVRRLMHLAHSERGVAAAAVKRVKCCDFVNYYMDNQYVAEIADALRELKKVTDHIVIVDAPESPYFKRSADSINRYHAALQTIARAADAEVWIASDSAEFIPQDFVDISHFSPEGARKLAAALARRVPADWLPQN